MPSLSTRMRRKRRHKRILRGCFTSRTVDTLVISLPLCHPASSIISAGIKISSTVPHRGHPTRLLPPYLLVQKRISSPSDRSRLLSLDLKCTGPEVRGGTVADAGCGWETVDPVLRKGAVLERAAVIPIADVAEDTTRDAVAGGCCADSHGRLLLNGGRMTSWSFLCPLLLPLLLLNPRHNRGVSGAFGAWRMRPPMALGGPPD